MGPVGGTYGRLQRIIHGDFLAEHIEPGAIVLDAGCGPGRFTLLALELGGRVVAMDSAEGQLRLAQERIRSVPDALGFLRGDITELGFLRDASFDVTICFGGPLSYVRERRYDAAAHLVRVTRPDGVLLVSAMSRLGAVCQVVRSGQIADSAEPPRVRRALNTGELFGVPSTTVTGQEHPAMHLYTAQELASLFEGCDVIATAGSNVSVSHGLTPLEDLAAVPGVWEHVIEVERRCSRQPGMVDAGQHVIVALRRR
jgi:ubiquinone/menaquinone biosynthesis C-methylase UbiE